MNIFKGDESDPESETEDEAKAGGHFSSLLFAASKNRLDMFQNLKNELGKDDFQKLILQTDTDGYTGKIYLTIFKARVFSSKNSAKRYY